MMKKLLLPLAAAVVLSVATPSFATFWHNNNDKNNWSFNWPKQDDGGRDWWNHDNKRDFPVWNNRPHQHSKSCGHNDNPVPEPATAGLAFMGLGALACATRRRK